MSEGHDQIGVVLRECEETLRTLSAQGRLTVNALSAFADLAARIRQEMERRKQLDRRETSRGTPDRRAEVVDQPGPATAGERAAVSKVTV